MEKNVADLSHIKKGFSDHWYTYFNCDFQGTSYPLSFWFCSTLGLALWDFVQE